MSLSRSHCNVQPSPAGTRGSGAAGPRPGKGSHHEPLPCPGSTRLNQQSHKSCTSRETAAEQTALPDVQSGYKAPSRACGMPVRGRCNRDSGRGEGPAGSGDGCSGHPQHPARARRSCPLQTPPTRPRDSKTSSHVYLKPFVKLSQQIPSINSAPLALAIQRGLIKLSLQGTDRQS